MDDNRDLRKTRMGALAGALFLFGLALVIWLDILIPGIFAVLWVTVIPPLLADKGWRYTLWLLMHLAAWFGGIGYMLAAGSLWPGILVLAGVSALLVAIAPPEHLEVLHEAERHNTKTKHKRRGVSRLAIPVPDDTGTNGEIDDALHDLRAADAQRHVYTQGDTYNE